MLKFLYFVDGYISD